MHKRTESIEITCDQCGRKILKPSLGIRIRVGNCQPDHRVDVELQLMGDTDLCQGCLKDLIINGGFGVFE